jgi:hypothetical protein
MMHGPEKSDCHSSWEADEQSGAIRNGVGGAKGRDQGECGPTKHVLDSEPDKRDTRCWLAYGSVLPSRPKVGAVCGKAARTDLCAARRTVSLAQAEMTAPEGVPFRVLMRASWRYDNGPASGRC